MAHLNRYGTAARQVQAAMLPLKKASAACLRACMYARTPVIISVCLSRLKSQQVCGYSGSHARCYTCVCTQLSYCVSRKRQQDHPSRCFVIVAFCSGCFLKRSALVFNVANKVVHAHVSQTIGLLLQLSTLGGFEPRLVCHVWSRKQLCNQTVR